jgi:hypothetical protein
MECSCPTNSICVAFKGTKVWSIGILRQSLWLTGSTFRLMTRSES